MAIIRVYPAPGRKVREPNTMRTVPAAGIEVDSNDFYWVRRLRDKDVVTEQPAAPAKPAAPAQGDAPGAEPAAPGAKGAGAADARPVASPAPSAGAAAPVKEDAGQPKPDGKAKA